ncbi:MAG: DMT family transporter [Proteobacteria bacterium]|nr:DMT family transporter [Pseudomonadota bacterium]
MAPAIEQNRLKAALLAMLAVGLSCIQDALVKGVSGELPAYEAVVVRTLTSLPMLYGYLWLRERQTKIWPENIGLILARSFILCGGYFCFVLSLAALPIATSVSIYFTMPFFVAALAGWALGERVKAYRWAAITAGFIGVLIMVRPGADTFEPAAILALASAFLYALGQMMGRKASQSSSPAIIATWQTIIYLAVGLGIGLLAPLFAGMAGDSKVLNFLLRPWVMPDLTQFFILLGMGVLGTLGSVIFVAAYKIAEANFVAPFEYTALLWAVINGIIFFGDFPDLYTMTGAAIVILAGLWMLRRDLATTAKT